jgi:hypothetical protein
MWYYSIDGKQQGPVDDRALDNLTTAGAVTADTYVWKEGMTNWAPLRQVRPFHAPAVGAGEACSICGRQVGADNLIELLGNRVCADCKPMAVQSLKEGAGIRSTTVTAWRDGKTVVAFDKTALPARCYRCNHDTVGAPLKRKVYWHHPAWYLLLILRAVPYLIVALFVRKRATLDIYLCDKHRQQRIYTIIGVWIGMMLGLGLTFTGIAAHLAWLGVLGGLLFLGSAIASIVGGTRVARAAKIKKDGTVWLRGSGKEFLASLPDWTGPSRNA